MDTSGPIGSDGIPVSTEEYQLFPENTLMCLLNIHHRCHFQPGIGTWVRLLLVLHPWQHLLRLGVYSFHH